MNTIETNKKVYDLLKQKFETLAFEENRQYKTWRNYLKKISCTTIQTTGNSSSTDILIPDPSPFDNALIVIPADVAEKILVLGLP